MRNVNLYMPVAVVAEESPISSLEWIGFSLRGLWCALNAAFGSADKPRDAERQRALQRQFEALITTHSALISRICFSYAADSEDITIYVRMCS